MTPSPIGAPGSITLRPPRHEDASALAGLVGSVEQHVDGLVESTPDDIRFVWGWARFDLDHDAWVAWQDATPIGYGWVWGPHRPHPDYDGRLWLHLPDFPSEAAAALLERMETRALERWREDSIGGQPILSIPCSRRDEAKRAFLTSRGYRQVRSFFRMDRPLDQPFEAPMWPVGAEVTAFRAGVDEAVMHELMQDSFADHYRFMPEPLEEWARRGYAHPDFAPDLSFIVRHQGQAIAGSLNFRSGREGWVGMLGTRQPWRRRGLGTALLLQSFAAFRDAGLEVACLGVDAENADRAVALYEAVGMSVVRRDELFVRDLPA